MCGACSSGRYVLLIISNSSYPLIPSHTLTHPHTPSHLSPIVSFYPSDIVLYTLQTSPPILSIITKTSPTLGLRLHFHDPTLSPIWLSYSNFCPITGGEVKLERVDDSLWNGKSIEELDEVFIGEGWANNPVVLKNIETVEPSSQHTHI